jgi:cytochrome c biogenesis DsbD-like protein
MIAVDHLTVQAWWVRPSRSGRGGVISFASPCVLPLIPGYLAFVSGGRSSERRRDVVPMLLFALGFTIVFTLLFGFAASSVGRWLRMPAGQRVARRVRLRLRRVHVAVLAPRTPGLGRPHRGSGLVDDWAPARQWALAPAARSRVPDGPPVDAGHLDRSSRREAAGVDRSSRGGGSYEKTGGLSVG